MNHSPGPWTLTKRSPPIFNSFEIVDANNFGLIKECLDNFYTDLDDGDWKLIAAAPELLSSLKTLLETLKENCVVGANVLDAIGNANLVIRKAEHGCNE